MQYTGRLSARGKCSATSARSARVSERRPTPACQECDLLEDSRETGSTRSLVITRAVRATGGSAGFPEVSDVSAAVWTGGGREAGTIPRWSAGNSRDQSGFSSSNLSTRSRISKPIS